MDADRAARLHAAIDRAFGDEFTLQGYTVGDDEEVDAPKIPDESRPAFDVVGEWAGAGHGFYPHARGIASDHAQRRTGTKPTVKVDMALLQWRPMVDDRVTRKLDGSLYVITEAIPDGFGRVVLYLTGRAAA